MRVWCWPGSTADYVIGEKLRSGSEAKAVLSRQGRDKTVAG